MNCDLRKSFFRCYVLACPYFLMEGWKKALVARVYQAGLLIPGHFCLLYFGLSWHGQYHIIPIEGKAYDG